MTEELHRVRTVVDEDGVSVSEHLITPSGDTVNDEVVAPPPVAVPVIFVPGVMGSNLRASRNIVNPRTGDELASRGSRVWDVDKEVKFSLREGTLPWWGRDAATRQLLLNKDVLEVDDSGLIEEGRTGRIGAMGHVRYTPNGHTPLSGLSMEAARARGWGEVSWYSYGPFLDWLDHQLNGMEVEQGGQPNEVLAEFLRLAGTTPPGVRSPPSALAEDGIRKLLDIYFPVHAVGYNWLESNIESGEHFASKINSIIQQYASRHHCEKVIVITHSMGGFVTRAASKLHKAEGNILAVIHGVMPTDGAALFYKRLVAGTMGEGRGLGRVAADLTVARILGRTARETTPVLGHAPGPLELAPNQLYNGGQPWLFIRDADGKLLGEALPGMNAKGERDPYGTVYRAGPEWWRAINQEWLNPAGVPGNAMQRHEDALEDAENFHDQLAESGFHPNTYAHYGHDPKFSIWGKVTWRASSMEYRGPTLDIGPSRLETAPHRWHRTGMQIAGAPAQWGLRPGGARMPPNAGEPGRFLHDAAGIPVRCEILPPDDPGDGTVPGAEGAAGITRSRPKTLCVTTDHDHQGSCQSEDVRAFVLDAVVRAAAEVEVQG